jgi:hypothetical protein
MLQSISNLPQNPVTGTFGGGNVQFIFASTIWLVPAGVNVVRVRLWGAGGAYNSGYAGQGGGFALKTIYDLNGVTSIAVSVGTSAQNSPGGTSSFGSFVSATGGGATTNVGISTLGGVGIGGDINSYGGGIGSSGPSCGGGGSGSLFGNGGVGYVNNGYNSFGGAGGGGSNSSGNAGGNGFMSTGAQYGSYNSVPASPGVYLTFPSIDYIGTGGGGVSSYGGVNGGGGGQSSDGGFPGGGSGVYGRSAPGLVIVEW